jgi:hypothetical protein
MKRHLTAEQARTSKHVQSARGDSGATQRTKPASVKWSARKILAARRCLRQWKMDPFVLRRRLIGKIFVKAIIQPPVLCRHSINGCERIQPKPLVALLATAKSFRPTRSYGIDAMFREPHVPSERGVFRPLARPGRRFRKEEADHKLA